MSPPKKETSAYSVTLGRGAEGRGLRGITRETDEPSEPTFRTLSRTGAELTSCQFW